MALIGVPPSSWHIVCSCRRMRFSKLFVALAGLTFSACSGMDSESKTPTDPWRATSSRIEVFSFAYEDGSSGFGAARTELSSEQVEALEGLQVIENPTGPLGNDFASYSIRIWDEDATVTRYRAASDDVLDGDEADHTLPTIAFASLSPFLETFHCLRAQDTRGSGEASVGPVTGAAAVALGAVVPSVSTSARGCRHGLFSVGGSAIWLRLEVEEAGTYSIATEECFPTTELHLFSSDGGDEVASASGAFSACPTLEQHFVEPGSYPLLVQVPPGAHGGDFFLSISPR
jgi:hypothetical protein